MNIYPYVYKLTHKTTGEFYIGYRCANKVPAEQDLGHKYFTSSKYVKPRFHEFIYHVVAEFFDNESAYDFEQTLIRENFSNEKIINKHYTCGNKNYIRTQRPWNKGLTKDTDGRLIKTNISPLKGKLKSEEHKRKMSAARKNKTHSTATKEKISNSQKGKKRGPYKTKNRPLTPLDDAYDSSSGS